MMKTDELINAIEEQDLNRLAALLEEGADPNRGLPRHPESLPLHVAVEEVSLGGPLETITLLLRHGAHPDGEGDRRSATPLMLAIMHGLREVIYLLLTAGADPNLVSDEGVSALRLAVEQKDVEMASTLLRSGAGSSIDGYGGPSGMSALGRASSNLDLPMIEILIAAGADPDALDADHRSARDRLPRRETNPSSWDKAMSLLEQRS